MIVMLILARNEAYGQLISPGKLSSAHTTLEGIRQCTQCHQLRERGVANERCLDCHAPLQTRIDDRTGLHATFNPQSCAECHKEHGGIALDIVRFDTAGFDHDSVGFHLAGQHAETTCRDCHAPGQILDPEVRRFKSAAGALSRTFLGLGTTCTACHADEDPHGDQFSGQTCDDCHDESAWAPAPGFDHNSTRYRLTGRHQRVECQECHEPTVQDDGTIAPRYRPLSFQSCTDCHDDVHDGAMGRSCTDCHATSGWRRVNRSRVEGRFDHSTTRFPLVGSHDGTECAMCHQYPATRTDAIHMTLVRGTESRTYPTPNAVDCVSCHVDYHDNVFAQSTGGIVCDNCHGQDTWFPTSYDMERHDRESVFALEGAHATVPCTVCHQDLDTGKLIFRIPSETCTDCHRNDDPHVGQFNDRPCDECHDLQSFTVGHFDHTTTRFELDGAHESVPCMSCHVEETTAGGHTFQRYRPVQTDCASCHGAL